MAHTRARNNVFHQHEDDIQLATRSRTEQNGHSHINYTGSTVGVSDEDAFPVVMVRVSGS